MKRRRFPILLIFLSVLTLLFSGCDIDSLTYFIPDGSTVEYNTNSGTDTYDTFDESDFSYSDEETEDEDHYDKDFDSVENTDIDTDSDDSYTDDISDDKDIDEDDDYEDVNSSNDNSTERDDSDVSDNGNALNDDEDELTVSEDGEYTSKDEVALYIHLYNHLPSNYITKNEAKDLGWDSSKGNLNKVAPGKSIGGDKFGNREGLLPKKDGRVYYECDIDYKKGSRNAKRIVFSNDGLIYYTEDHYETYELLYE